MIRYTQILHFVQRVWGVRNLNGKIGQKLEYSVGSFLSGCTNYILLLFVDGGSSLSNHDRHPRISWIILFLGGMRSRDPQILTYVKKSVFSSLLVILIFTSVFFLYYQVLEIIATIHVRIYFHQISFEKNCTPDDPSEWGPYLSSW